MNRIRGLESTLADLGPRSAELAEKIEAIESAHEAADQLPTDLRSLSEARDKLSEISAAATQALDSCRKELARIEKVREEADKLDDSLKKSATAADAVIARAESAYSAATSQGLAAAFSERSKKLAASMWVWVVVLFCALFAGAAYGYVRFREIAALLQTPDASDFSIAVNVFMSLLTVGAAVWLGWIATKQIGQRFRLAEDYAFKASVSSAYEGFRREAARIDQQSDLELEARLLESALTRLDEQPLRLVEAVTHGSPFHELLESDVIRDALRAIPGFGAEMNRRALEALGQTKKSPSAAPTLPKSEVTVDN